MSRQVLLTILLLFVACRERDPCHPDFFSNDVPTAATVPLDSASMLIFNVLEFNSIDRLECEPNLSIVQLGKTIDTWQIDHDTIIRTVVGFEKSRVFPPPYDVDVTSVYPLDDVTYLKIINGNRADWYVIIVERELVTTSPLQTSFSRILYSRFWRLRQPSFAIVGSYWGEQWYQVDTLIQRLGEKVSLKEIIHDRSAVEPFLVDSWTGVPNPYQLARTFTYHQNSWHKVRDAFDQLAQEYRKKNYPYDIELVNWINQP